MTTVHKSKSSPNNPSDTTDVGMCGRATDMSPVDELWDLLPPEMFLRGEELKYCEQQILHELIETGEVDCDQVVQIIQLMALSEFAPFFKALCSIDLKDPAKCADQLARCAYRLGPKPMPRRGRKRVKLAAA